MSWEWVTLILGIFSLIILLLGWITWTQMRVRMFEALPKTLPDMMARTKSPEALTEIKEPEDGRT